jgi:hypothetical protein
MAGLTSQDRYFAFDGLQNLALVSVGSILNPSAELDLKYGPSGERYLRRETVNGSTTTTRTIGAVERITRPGGVIETKRYIGGVLIETRYSNGTPTTKRTLLPDGLGSTDTLVTEGGAAHERQSFDGHGNRRNAADWRMPLASYTPQNTTDGFTGHEHLDPLDLVRDTEVAGVLSCFHHCESCNLWRMWYATLQRPSASQPSPRRATSFLRAWFILGGQRTQTARGGISRAPMQRSPSPTKKKP